LPLERRQLLPGQGDSLIGRLFSFPLHRLHLLALVFLLYSLAAGFKIAATGSITSFFGFGCRPDICFAGLNGATLPGHTVVYSSGGYDGQFYYYLAAEMGGAGPALLDAPAFRRARIGFVYLTFWLYRAGPEALSLGMPIFLFLSHLLLVYWNSERQVDLMSAALALNPVSLLSFLLVLPDGLALQLALLAFQGLARAADWPGQIFFTGLLSFSLLVKETMLAFPMALGSAALIHFLVSGQNRKAQLRLMTLAILSALPLALWWSWVGFTPGQAASRGSWPFSGVIEYFSNAPSRSQYVLLFLLIAGLYRLGIMAQSLEWRAAPGFLVLLFSLGLASFASADEYWANFANIARLFLPLLGAFFLLRHRFPGSAVAMVLIGMGLLLLADQLRTPAGIHWQLPPDQEN